MLCRLDDFKEEEALVGRSRECFEVLRHYGYAVFAEVAQQTRSSLKVPQLSWIVHRSCCIIHDPSRPASSHNTAVQLLGNLVEVIHKYRMDASVSDKCRELLRKILDCFVVKLKHVKNIQKMVHTCSHSAVLSMLCRHPGLSERHQFSMGAFAESGVVESDAEHFSWSTNSVIQPHFETRSPDW